MKNRNHICRLVFFAAMLALVLSLAVCAVAEGDPCPEGSPHKGPYSYRNRVNATCTETGRQDKYCDACGRFVGTEIISAIGHQFEDSTKVITAPTCLTNGLKQISSICKVCNYNGGTKDEVTPALGHDWGSWNVTTAATCTETGVETRICKRDSSHVETKPIAALGHDWGPWTVTKQPTCENPGVFTRTCKNDSSHQETKPIDPIGHDWGPWTVTKQPTCEVPGENTRICKNDSSHKETEPISPIGHKWDSGKVTKQPDCTNPGVRTFTCLNDSSHTKTEPIPINPDAHKWDSGKVTKKPTCATPGVRTYTCLINSAHTKTEPIPIDPDAHDYDNGTITKQPTCEQPGVKTYVCRNDSSHTKTEPVPATGHKWDDGVIIKKPTLTEEGEKKYTCQNDPTHIKIEKLSVLTMTNNTVCAFGPRLRSDEPRYPFPYITNLWYMYTPFDASSDGVQTYDLVASNMYIVGTVTLTIRDGNLLIDYKLSDPTKFSITLEFFTVLNSINDLTRYEPEELMNLRMIRNQPINLAENFGEDTSLVLYFCSRCDYAYSAKYQSLAYTSAAHARMLTAMLALMD